MPISVTAATLASTLRDRRVTRGGFGTKTHRGGGIG
jgi:hypothetical protein